MIDLLRSRRSIRRYQDKPLAAELVARLKEAVLRSPSSRGLDPCEFVFVEDRQLLVDLAATKAHGSSFLRYAALAIVVVADGQRSDVWIEDSSIATTIAHLSAHAAGLGSCWIQIRERAHDDKTSAADYVRGLLNIPATLQVEAILAVGYPDADKPGRPFDKLDFSKIHQDYFSYPVP